MAKFIKCKICNKEFRIYPCQIKRGRKYCSKKCCSIGVSNKMKGVKRPPFSKEWRENISKSVKGVIPGRNKGTKMPPYSEAYIQKQIESHKGEKSYNWKGGRSRGYKTGYYSRDYKIWRTKVFERDSYICQNCKTEGGYLTVHHIKSFAHYPELRFDLDNGITLCENCHKSTDNYKGRNKCVQSL